MIVEWRLGVSVKGTANVMYRPTDWHEVLTADTPKGLTH